MPPRCVYMYVKVFMCQSTYNMALKKEKGRQKKTREHRSRNRCRADISRITAPGYTAEELNPDQREALDKRRAHAGRPQTLCKSEICLTSSVSVCAQKQTSDKP